MKVVLAGDIGGTKTLLQIAEVEGKDCRIYHEARFTSGEWSGFLPLVEDFFRTAPLPLPETACFAVAGPVEGKRTRLTNLPWQDLDATHLAAHFGMRQVRLINDFLAVGYGIEGLAETELATLQTGHEQPQAPRALLGAGTGLGQGILVWKNGRYDPLDTEGGHVDFAPLDEEQEGLLRFLRTRHDHVSYERLLSGSGLVEIYRFLCSQTKTAQELATIGTDQAAAISAAALDAVDPVAVHTLHLFARIYGQQAGNLALTCLARGGVYVAGGIAPRILPFLQNGEFIRAFRAKGRMERLLVEMPVRVVLNPRVGLLGAAIAAARA
ncbi:Glucokinase [Gammaproteobacteria bacterium]